MNDMISDGAGPADRNPLAIRLEGSTLSPVLAAENDGLSDDTAGASNKVASFDVSRVAAPSSPVAVDDACRVSQWLTFGGCNPLDNDSDPEADPLRIVAIDGQAAEVGELHLMSGGGSVRVMEDGSFWIKATGGAFPDLGGYPAYTGFSYTVSDGHGGTDVAHVAVTVQDNRAPVAVGTTIYAGTDTVASSRLFTPHGGVWDGDCDPDRNEIHIVGLRLEGARQRRWTPASICPGGALSAQERRPTICSPARLRSRP